ncbi:MAG TPA: DUF4386 domain-containing protein [Sphingomonadales bacterium]|nr:DUF4386 domain-containing protein [Sphingomonadales bacterium]
MAAGISGFSPRQKARIAGVLYLLIIAGGAFAELYVREAAFVSTSATATVQNILSQPLRFRLGFAVHLAYLLCAVPIAVIFYGLFKRVSSGLALLMFAFNLVAIAVEGAAVLNHFAAIRILDAVALGGLSLPEATPLAYSFLRLFFSGFAISLVFFAGFCLSAGVLIYRSGFLPRVIGPLMGLAGIAYLVNSFSLFIAPAFASLLFPFVLLPPFAAELTLALWLTIKGLDETAFAKLAP